MLPLHLDCILSIFLVKIQARTWSDLEDRLPGNPGTWCIQKDRWHNSFVDRLCQWGRYRCIGCIPCIRSRPGGGRWLPCSTSPMPHQAGRYTGTRTWRQASLPESPPGKSPRTTDHPGNILVEPAGLPGESNCPVFREAWKKLAAWPGQTPR